MIRAIESTLGCKVTDNRVSQTCNGAVDDPILSMILGKSGNQEVNDKAHE